MKARFQGNVDVRWLPDGRRMKLLATYSFTDSIGTLWVAPADWIIDGASIPRFLWRIIGGPYEGKYRNASVVHDVYCVTKSRPSWAVHQMFYEGMRAAGCSRSRAFVMWCGVRFFGPQFKGK